MKDLERAPWLGEVAGVLSGYLGDARQAVDVAALVHRVKAKNPNALYVCDPVMGDAGGLYVPEATAEAMRDLSAAARRHRHAQPLRARMDRRARSSTTSARPPPRRWKSVRRACW